MIGIWRALAVILLAVSALLGQDGADLVILGPIRTFDEARPYAEGLVVSHGRILRLTDDASARSAIGPNTRVITVPEGGAAMPGIIESHAHLAGVGRQLRTLDLRTCKSSAEVAQRVAEVAATLPPDAWIRGRGWSQELWEDRQFPDRFVLDGVCGGRPCWLQRVDGHAAWVNTRALEIAGALRDAVSPPGGEVLRLSDGTSSGILVDRAMDLVSPHLPSDTHPTQLHADYLAAQAEAFRLGITTFVDAGNDREGLLHLTELYNQGRMKLRVHAMVSINSEADLQLLIQGPPIPRLFNDRLAIRSIKLYADGALGSRGAWLLEPYADRPGHSGLQVLDPQFVERVARMALAHGYQVCTHAIGDRGCRETLSAYERALSSATAQTDHRFRIEHAQILAPEDIPRFAALGVIPSMQGCHCSSDGPWVPQRIGADRSRGAYAWRSLIAAGCRIPNGTDAPVEDLSPWRNLYATLTRAIVRHDGETDTFHPEQRMNRTEALWSVTRWGAYGVFAEDRRGMLRPGFEADIVVLDRDPETCPVWHLGRALPLHTIVAGEVVFSR